jgi:hypothetical protein
MEKKRQRSRTKVSFRCNVCTSAANNGNCYSPKLKMKLYLFFHVFFPILGNKMKRYGIVKKKFVMKHTNKVSM